MGSYHCIHAAIYGILYDEGYNVVTNPNIFIGNKYIPREYQVPLTVLTSLVGPSIINIAKNTMVGAQFGLVNIAGNTRGVQIGLINYSKSLSGVQIGLINVVHVGGGAVPFLPIINIGLSKKPIKSRK